MSMTEMVRQTVLTPQLISAASMLVRLAHPGEASLHRALEKAETRLMVQAWRVDSGILQIASHSRPNEVVCCDGDTCTCPTTRGVCYHIAAWHILSALCAAGVHPVADLPLPAALDDDELPATSFLDGPFDAFEDTRLIGDASAGDEWWDQVQSQDAPSAPLPRRQAQTVVPALDTRVYFDEVDELPARCGRRGVVYKGEYFSEEYVAALETARRAA